jgi:hypothetical protein
MTPYDTLHTPTPHKHKALTDIYYAAPEWWDVYSRLIGDDFWDIAKTPYWLETKEYELRKSAKHPDNIKPKKRLIDWAKMPRGAMTNCGTFLSVSKQYAHILQDNDYAVCILLSELRLRLKEQTQFTYWGGGECPVPEGLSLEILSRGNGRGPLPSCVTSVWQHSGDTRDIIAYRITGLADGWTDNPEEAK